MIAPPAPATPVMGEGWGSLPPVRPAPRPVSATPGEPRREKGWRVRRPAPGTRQASLGHALVSLGHGFAPLVNIV
jgi:hypothetical protein